MKYSSLFLTCMLLIVSLCTSLDRFKPNWRLPWRLQHDNTQPRQYAYGSDDVARGATLIARSSTNTAAQVVGKLVPRGSASDSKPASMDKNPTASSSTLQLRTDRKSMEGPQGISKSAATTRISDTISRYQPKETLDNKKENSKNPTATTRGGGTILKDASTKITRTTRISGNADRQAEGKKKAHEALTSDDSGDEVGAKSRAYRARQGFQYTKLKNDVVDSRLAMGSTGYRGALRRKGKAVRVINHAIQHPFKVLSAVSEATGNGLAGLTAAAFTGDSKAIVPGVCLGCKTIVDTVQKMDEAEIDKARAYDQGQSHGISRAHIERADKIDRALKAFPKAARGAFRYIKKMGGSRSKKQLGAETKSQTGLQSKESSPLSWSDIDSDLGHDNWQDLGQDPDVRQMKEMSLTRPTLSTKPMARPLGRSNSW